MNKLLDSNIIHSLFIRFICLSLLNLEIGCFYNIGLNYFNTILLNYVQQKFGNLI